SRPATLRCCPTRTSSLQSSAGQHATSSNEQRRPFASAEAVDANGSKRRSRHGGSRFCPTSPAGSPPPWWTTTSGGGSGCERRTSSALPLDHRQGIQRVLPPSINRQFHESSMKACARPRGGDSRDERAREPEPS